MNYFQLELPFPLPASWADEKALDLEWDFHMEMEAMQDEW